MSSARPSRGQPIRQVLVSERSGKLTMGSAIALLAALPPLVGMVSVSPPYDVRLCFLALGLCVVGLVAGIAGTIVERPRLHGLVFAGLSTFLLICVWQIAVERFILYEYRF